MTRDVSDEEFAAVSRLQPAERYDYFVKRAADGGAVWGLRFDDGWVVAEDPEGRRALPVWPHSRFAEAGAVGDWAGGIPTAIDIDEFVAVSLDQLSRDEMLVIVFPGADNQGQEVGTARLGADLEAELAQFGP
jgi:hypothetical protein